MIAKKASKADQSVMPLVVATDLILDIALHFAVDDPLFNDATTDLQADAVTEIQILFEDQYMGHRHELAE